MWAFDNMQVPQIKTSLPGPRAQTLLERDQRFVSPSYTRIYPLVAARGSGAVIEDLDGNLFLDFTAGIAVVSTGHCHPHVVAAIQDQAAKLIHMSGTDFYYEPQTDLAQRLAEIAPGKSPKRVFFTNSGAEVHLPFGGVKKSGNGHPSAAGLIETVTHKIAWTVNHALEVKMAQGLKTEIG